MEGKAMLAKEKIFGLHHLKPFAKGGENSPANLSLRCQKHNLYQAQQDFGLSFMAKIVKEAGRSYGLRSWSKRLS